MHGRFQLDSGSFNLVPFHDVLSQLDALVFLFHRQSKRFRKSTGAALRSQTLGQLCFSAFAFSFITFHIHSLII